MTNLFEGIEDVEVKEPAENKSKKISVGEIIARIKKSASARPYGNPARFRLENASTDEDGVLCCPDCGANGYLHQKAAISIWRDAEDSRATLVFSSRGRIEMERISDGEAPGRRDSLYILFTCEVCDGCDHYRVLEIMQHKGITFAVWRGDLTAEVRDDQR